VAFKKKFQLVIAPVGDLASTLAQGIDVSELRCTFVVKKTLKPTPNHAVIEVYNLSRDSCAFLECTKALRVRLDAGYEDEGTSQIYLGEVRTADTRQVGPEYITKMSTDDKGRKLQKTQINVPIGPGTTIEAAIRLLLQSFKLQGGAWGQSTVEEGNLKYAMGELKKLGVTSLYPRGGLLSGYSAQIMTDICRSANLEWSVQDGALFLRPVGTALGDRSISLSSASGLIGSPALDNEGRLTAECVMIPGIRPGIVIDLDSKFLKGGFRLTEVHYHGDTHGPEWKMKLKGEKY
jgi:hypothetical protein